MLRVKLDRLVFKSIREFEDVEIKLNSGINVIQIRNGYGKTSTLTILRWMFTGDDDIETGDYPKYVRGKEVADHDYDGKSSVTLHMTIDNDGVSNLWRLTMNFRPGEGRCWFETESPAIGGHQDGWRLPPAFKSKFHGNGAFTNLFMFDGEAAADLSKSQDHDQIIQAIRELTGLKGVYQHIDGGGFLDKDRNAAFAESNIKDLQNSNTRFANASIDLELHAYKLESKRNRSRKKIETFEGQLSKLKAQEKEIKAQTDYQVQIKKLETEKRKKKRLLSEETTNLLNATGNPSNIPGLWDEVMQFNSSLVEAKLPEGVGRVFFTDILEEDTCICGRPMDKDAKDSIEQHSAGYLSDGILTVVNSMQSEIKSSQNSMEDLDELSKKISELQYQIVGIDQDISAITDNFDQAAQTQLDNIKKLVKQKQREKEDLERELEEITETDPAIIHENGWDSEIFKQNGDVVVQKARFEKCKNLFSLKKVEREINKRLASTKPLHQLNVGTEKVKEVISEALEAVMERTHQSLQEETQEIFDRIPGTGGAKVIKLGEKGFHFYDDHGSEQSGINMGGMLSAAYSFVSSMSQLGSVTIPLVCDSPVTGMDTMTVGGYVQEVWPLFDQMVIFATPGERKNIEDVPDNDKSYKLLYSEEVTRITLHREDEDNKGIPQKGRMIVNEEDDWFKKYGAKPADR